MHVQSIDNPFVSATANLDQPVGVVDQVFNSLWGSLARSEGVPTLDVTDTPDAFVVLVELPGIPQDAVEISLERDVLTVRGERKPEEGDGRRYLWQERTTGPFSRTLRLPQGVDPSKVRALFRDGLLEIRLPKRQEVKPRRIQVEVG
ncbi:MAG: Hsp20/alpha crystallin family protein [Candidatus Methylomirabilales bacterium]